MSTIAPSGVERTFGDEELIVSKTDPKGVILYANDVFLRVAAWSEEDLIGRPHNVIRHPDMPRCVFRLLWDTLEAGQEMFAYIVNLAADGAHYWVYAHVTPSYDASGRLVGYHSSRRTPRREAVDRIRPLYAQLLAEERRHPHKQEGMAASCALLTRILAERGQTYDEFVWSLAAEPPRPGREARKV